MLNEIEVDCKEDIINGKAIVLNENDEKVLLVHQKQLLAIYQKHNDVYIGHMRCSMSYILHDRYEIIGELGTGGMSQVYLCVDNHIGKKWAVKKIHCSKQNIKLIESEISTLKALDYPLFPRITDAWIGQGSVTGDSSYYIVTDYIDGVSLDKVLKTRQVLPESTVIKYVNDLANALKFLHCQSPPILYLDMKPSNIMVKKDGSIMQCTWLRTDFISSTIPRYFTVPSASACDKIPL